MGVLSGGADSDARRAGVGRALSLALAMLGLACTGDPTGVRALPVVNIAVTPDALTLRVGATAALEASTTDLYGNLLEGREVEWSSSATDIVSVSANGVVTALSPGSARVGAYSDQSAGFADVVVQLDFQLPVSAGAVLRAEIGSPTSACPDNEGGRRESGRYDCSHAGISSYSLDFKSPEQGMPMEVRAAAEGRVSDVCLQPPPEKTCGPNGPFVFIEHISGFTSFYAHLDPASVTVRRKMVVAQGETLGRMGAWGPEPYPWTHFELRYRNQGANQRRILDGLLVGGKKLTEYRLDQ